MGIALAPFVFAIFNLIFFEELKTGEMIKLFKQFFLGVSKNKIKSLKTSGICVFIRGCSVLSNFILHLFLAKYFVMSEYGVYGLIQSTLVIGVYLIGFDFYVYANRELPKRDKRGIQEVVLSQAVVYVVTYLAFIPAILYFSSRGFIPSRYIFWFGTLLVLEHVTQEIFRVLVGIQYPVSANLLVVFRRILWISVFILLGLFNPAFLNIESLFLCWISGLVLTLIFGLFLLFKKGVLPFGKWKPNMEFIIATFKGSLVFFGTSICYNGILFSGRYFLKYFYSNFEVGIYVFFQNIGNFMDIFLYSAVIMIFLPKVIKSRYKQDLQSYEAKANLMYGAIFYFVAALTVFLILAIKPLLWFVEKPEVADNLSVFYILLASYAILSFSLIGHYALYINHGDKKIMISAFIGVVTNLVLNIILIPSYGLYGCAFSLLISVVIMGVLKMRFAFEYKDIEINKILSAPINYLRLFG